jgi:hypothetical protein
MRLREHALGLRDVHEAHDAGREVEGRLAERQSHRAGDPIVDAQRLVLLRLRRVTDEDGGDAHRRHPRAPPGQQPGVVAFSPVDVQALEPLHVREHREEGRGVRIPVAAHFFVIHPWLPSEATRPT